MNLTQAHLHELLNYNPDTGVFTTRLVGKGRPPAGKPRGSLNKISGYLEVGVDNKTYYGHRLAWFYMTGVWPEHHIDHINGVRHDNRWSNLREAPGGVNSHNIGGPLRNNKLKTLGVSFHKGMGRYRAVIVTKGRQRTTWHETQEAAAADYLRMKDEFHPEHRRLRKETP